MKDTAAKTSGASSADDILDARLAYETRLVLSRDPTASRTGGAAKFYKEALAMPKRPALVNASMNMSDKIVGQRRFQAENWMRLRLWAASCLILMPL